MKLHVYMVHLKIKRKSSFVKQEKEDKNMGLFSWCTSDTRKSISAHMNGYEGAPKTVYLLNPFGEAFKETYYDGYGNFGGQDVYALVAKWNAPEMCKDENGNWLPDDEIRDIGIDLACYDEDHVQLKYPIKIVEELCPYEKADISPSCPFQGHFYPDAGLDNWDWLKLDVYKAFEHLSAAKEAYNIYLACDGKEKAILRNLNFSYEPVDKAFIKIASTHSKTPEKVLLEIACKSDQYQQQTLLDNSKLPLSVLRELEKSNSEWVQKTAKKRIEYMVNNLAADINEFSRDYDSYEYADAVDNVQEFYLELCDNITDGNVQHLVDWFKEIVENDEIPENIEKAKELLNRLGEFEAPTEKEKASLDEKIKQGAANLKNHNGEEVTKEIKEIEK